jgi:hypothetical protein
VLIKIGEFRKFLERSKIQLLNKSIYEYLIDVLDGFDLVTYFRSMSDGEEKYENIKDFLSLTENENYMYNIDKFLDYLEYISNSPTEHIIGGGGNCVRITTMHSSKGLEYPAVIIGGMGKELQINKDKNNIIGENFRYDEIRERNFINIGAFVHHKSIIKKNGVFDTELTNYNWDLIVRYCTNHRPIFINKLLIEDYNEIENFNNNSELKKIKIKFMLYLHEKLKKINIFKFIKQKDKNIMFWGASLYLEYLLEKENQNINILGIIDTDAKKENEKICGYKIYQPEILKLKKPDYVIFTIPNKNKIIYPKVKKFIEENHPEIQLLPNFFD